MEAVLPVCRKNAGSGGPGRGPPRGISRLKRRGLEKSEIRLDLVHLLPDESRHAQVILILEVELTGAMGVHAIMVAMTGLGFPALLGIADELAAGLAGVLLESLGLLYIAEVHAVTHGLGSRLIIRGLGSGLIGSGLGSGLAGTDGGLGTDTRNGNWAFPLLPTSAPVWMDTASSALT